MRGAAAAILLLGITGCEASPTQIIVVVTTDLEVPGLIDEVKITGRGPSMSPQSVTVELAGQDDLPVTAGLRPANLELLSPLRVSVRLSGNLAGELEREAYLGWRLEESRVLELNVTGDCAGVVCGEFQQTCIDGVCQSGEVDSARLEEWDGSDPPTQPPFDGGA